MLCRTQLHVRSKIFLSNTYQLTGECGSRVKSSVNKFEMNEYDSITLIIYISGQNIQTKLTQLIR
jgi:hypothetical protein